MKGFHLEYLRRKEQHNNDDNQQQTEPNWEYISEVAYISILGLTRRNR